MLGGGWQQQMAGGCGQVVRGPWLTPPYPEPQLHSAGPLGKPGPVGLAVRRMPNKTETEHEAIKHNPVTNGKPDGPLVAHPSLPEVLG